VTARNLTVAAEDSETIFAVAGALAAQVSNRTVSAAVGVSVANNEIGTQTKRAGVKATINGATVTLTGNATVTAEAKPSLTSHTIAGALQGAKADTPVAGLSGAGAGNTNLLAIDTLAVITGSANVTADGSVAVTATDTSMVFSNAGGVGLGIVLSDSLAGGVTIGAARNVVKVTSTVRAAIETGSVTAGRDVSLEAKSKQDIDAVAFGVGINVAKGFLAASAAGSGASSYVDLNTTTTAEIVSATVTAGTSGSGSVSVKATDTPKTKARAGAGSLAASGGQGAAALAVGIVQAWNTLGNTVTARIGTKDEPAPTVTASGTGTVDVSAHSAATAEALSVAVAAAVAVGEPPFGLAGAGVGAFAWTTVTNTVTAEIGAGVVSGAHVTVGASEAHTLTNTVGAGVGVLSWVGASVGRSEAEATVNDTVTARIGAATVTATSGDITVDAGSANTIKTRSVPTSVALAVGGGGTAGYAGSRDISTVTAEVATGAMLTARSGGVNVVVGGVDGNYGLVEAQTDGGSLGLITVGKVWGLAEHAQTRLATVGGNVNLSNVGTLKVDATSRPDVKAQSLAVDVGVGLGVSDNETIAKVGGTTKATTGSGVTLPGQVWITASGTTTIRSTQGQGGGGTPGGVV
jgi:hypothetical protein